jgi:DNA-binding response OmpR family regulator
MQKFILAVSPDVKLLMQTQAHLQEGGRFSVVCVDSGHEALSTLKNQSFDIAILDGEISDFPFVPLTRELVAISPDLKLLVFPPQNNPRHPALTGLLASGFLNKPFFGPEVSEKIAQALKDRGSSAPESHSDNDLTNIWIKNPEVSAHQIEQLLASTTASAGILLLRGQVLASSGVLTLESSSNIINYLNRYWENIQSGELFRYLTMEHEASSYIIYAAPLIKDTAIALVYTTQKPLLEIRGEVTRLRKAFLERYSTTRELRQDYPIHAKGQAAGTGRDTPPVAANRLNTHRFSETPPLITLPEVEDEPEGLSEKELQSLNNMLAEMPPPDPELDTQQLAETAVEQPQTWTSSDQAWESTDEEPADLNEELPPIIEEEIPSVYPTGSGKTEPLLSKPPKVENFPNFDFVLPWEKQTSVENQVSGELYSSPPPLPLDQPFEMPPVNATLWTTSAPLSGDSILLPFTFLLFPADPGQFITRELAALCNQRLPQVLTDFGWQLNAISIRPLYLQWSASIPAFCSIPEKLSDIRLQLNTMLFTSFPGLLKNNPSGDFWLPGYFALSGSNPPSNRMINDFITLFRQVEPQLRSF